MGVHKEDEQQPLLIEPLKPMAVTVAGFACLSGLLLGYDIGITNGAVLPMQRYFDMSHYELELFVGTLNLFAMPGCLLGGYSAEWFGRRGAIGAGAALFLAGNALMTFAKTFAVLLVGRALAGVAVGMTLVTEPLYTAETSPARLRGMLSTNVEVSFNVGIVCGFWASYGLRGLPDATSWRCMFGLCLFAPVLSLVGVFVVLPESPRYLAARGRLEEAKQVVDLLLGPIEARKSIDLMKDSVKRIEEPELSWAEMFTSRKFRWLVILGGGVAFFSQATGIESIMYYSNIILTQGGLDRNSMLLATLVMGCFKLAAIMVQGSVVDVIGRRPLLVVSSLGMCACMMTLGMAFMFSWGFAFKVVPIVSFAVLFSLGYGPLVYTINAEIYPTSCRAKGLTFAMGVGRIVSALVSLTFLSLADLLSMGGAFIFFGFWGAVAAAFVVLLVPETMGKCLDEEEQEHL